MKLIAIALLVFASAGCCACRRAGNNAPIVNSTWQLVQLNGAAVAGSHADSFTLTLDKEGKAFGQGDCNRYNGPYSLEPNGKITFAQNMMVTRMMCPGAELESKYLAMLRTVDSYTVDGQKLLLLTKGEVAAIFDLMTEPVVSTQPIDEPREVK